MDLLTLDKASFQIIRRWNLDNLEHVLKTVSNETIKQHPFWYDLVSYDGMAEVLASLLMASVDDPIDVGMLMVNIDNSVDPIAMYLKYVEEARIEQKTRGLANILVNRYTRWCLAEQKLSQSVYIIKPVAEVRAEFFSNPLTLQNIYGDDWKQHYRPRSLSA